MGRKMNAEHSRKLVNSILGAVCDVDGNGLSPDTRLDDIGMTSVRRIILFAQLEKATSQSLSLDDVAYLMQAVTVQDFIWCVQRVAP